MDSHPFIKLFVVAILAAIVGSLASAFWLMFKRRDTGTAGVKALTIRVGLSIGLFALLMILYALGIIEPNR